MAETESYSAKQKGPEKLKGGKLDVVEFYPEQKKVRVLDVVVDICDLPADISARRFIPKWESLRDNVCWDTPSALLIRDMIIRLAGGIPSRSEGPTGVSKSFSINVLAALTGRNFIRQNYSKDSDPGDTVGRFVPSEGKIAVSFTELLANPKLHEQSKEIIERAKEQNRSLTVYESKLIAKNEGLSGLGDDHQWRWQNGSLVAAMIKDYGGSVYNADEPNLAPGNVTERENPALEKRPTFRISEHEGEVIRPLTPEENDIIEKGGRIAGIVGLSDKYWYSAAQNPWGIGGGRVEESEARRNRLQDRIVEPLTTNEYEEYLSYLIHGNQPDIHWKNRTYKGEKNIKTNYRDLENVPNIDVIIKTIAEFQTDLQDLTTSGKIGAMKDIKGGSYVFTRRNMERFLDTIKASQRSLLDLDSLTKTGKLTYNTSWHDLIMEGIYQEYLAGMYREDQVIVEKILEATGIENFLGVSQNNPKAPAWIIELRKKGIQVEEGQGEWTLSATSLMQAQVDLTAFREQLEAQGYKLPKNRDTLSQDIKIKAPLRTNFVKLFDEIKSKPVKPKRKSQKEHQ